ncbi:MAG: chromosome partitioning protein ParB [Bdellovibrionales bacterium]|nr:chromosome partitioning protein ParB [Bdellovibrionales bacterium]
MTIRFALLLLFFFTPATGRALPDCEDVDLEEGVKCKVRIKDLRPTQSQVGMVDVEAKREMIRDLEYRKKKFKKFKKDNTAELVMGPDGELFIIDRHHAATAFHMEGYKRMRAKIVEDLSDLEPEEFWREMKKRKWCWQYDECYRKIEVPKDLPKRIGKLKDDPYRSLAWVLRQKGCFEKTAIPFAEFYWGQALREKIRIRRGKAGFNAAVEKGMKICHSEAFSKLPGYCKTSFSALEE